MTEETDEMTTYAPRGKWDFSDAQRIIIGLLLWLNIIVLVIAVLLILGVLTP
ncbi:MAG TPA: hypothetical protein PK829_11545 [Promineifilum sp.]|nr:hypothetical protein [Promineifilum sp.]HQF70041.1 hypothetical protein [Promineifilum sp.]